MLQPTNKNSSGHLHRFGTLLFLLVWLAVLGVMAANRQNIYDWWRLRNYQAPAAQAQLAAQDTMTPYARKAFYVNKPEIADKPGFATNCPVSGGTHEQTIVLGCYRGNQGGIFLLSVTDPRLSGVEQVTAAHEMLHAAYDRLSGPEQSRIDALLLDYFHHDLHDERIQATLAAYKKTEPNDVVNEMHSIFGTEIPALPPALEQYYQRYFTDRSRVAAFAAQYQSVFTSRQTAITAAESQLASLKSRIEAEEADLQTRQANITAQQTILLEQRNSGNLTAYNAGVPSYNRLVDAYNNQVGLVKSLVGQFNELVAKHNALVFEQGQLRDELDANTNQALIKQ